MINQLKMLSCKASTAHFVEHTLLLNMSSNSSLQWMHFVRTNKSNIKFFVLSKSVIINLMLFLFVILAFTIPVITLQILSIPIFIVAHRSALNGPFVIKKDSNNWDLVTFRVLYIFSFIGLLNKFEICKSQNRRFQQYQ